MGVRFARLFYDEEGNRLNMKGILCSLLLVAGAAAYDGGFVPFGELVTPFPEQNVLGTLSPWLNQTSPSLKYNAAFSSYLPFNDFAFAYRPSATPDTFIGGVSFIRDLDKKSSLSGSFKFLSVDSIQNISGAVFQSSSRFQSYSIAPAWTYKFLPILSGSVETEISTLEFSGDRSWDFNASLSGAMELVPKNIPLFNKVAFGLSLRNVVGIFNSSAAPFQIQATAMARSWGERLSYGLGLNMVPSPGTLRPETFTMDLGASVFLFDLWRINLGLVGLGGDGMSFNASTSITVSQFQFSWGLRNLALSSSGVTVDNAKLEQVFGISIFYAASIVSENRKLIKELQRINTLLEKARAEMDGKRFRDAIDTYNAVFTIKKDVEEAKVGLQAAKDALAQAIDGAVADGRRQFNNAQYLESLRSFDRALTLDPGNEVATRYRTLARTSLSTEKKAILDRVAVYVKSKRLDDALAQADSALVIDPTDPDALKAKETVEKAMAEAVAAKDRLRKMQDLASLAELELERRNYDEALSFYKQATNYGAGPQMLRDWTAKVAGRKERDDKEDRANALYQKAEAQLAAANEALSNSLAGASSPTNGANPLEALEAIQQVLALVPDHPAAKAAMEKLTDERNKAVSNFTGEGLAALEKGDWQAARSNFAKAKTFDPGRPEIAKYIAQVESTVSRKYEEFMVKATTLERDGKLGEARQAYLNAAGVKPEEPAAKTAAAAITSKITSATGERREKAETLFKAKKFAEAKAELAGLIRDFGADPAVDGMIEKIDTYVDADRQFKELVTRFDNRSFGSAKPIADRLFAVRPDFPGLADLKKRIDEEVSRESRDEDLSRLFQEGVSEYKRKNFDKAIAKWEEVRKLDPKNDLVGEYIDQARTKKKEAEDKDFTEGMAAYQKKDFLTARNRLSAALKANPENEQARKTLTDLQFEIDTWKKSLVFTLAPAFKEGRYADHLATLATLSNIDGATFDRQDEAYRSRLATEFLGRGDNFKKQGRTADALLSFKKVLDLNPEDPVAARAVPELQNGLRRQKAQIQKDSETYFSQGRYEDAINLWKLLVNSDMTTGAEKSEYEDRIDSTQQKVKNMIDGKSREAASEESAGRLGKALDLYQQLLLLDAGNVTARRRIDAISAQLEAARQAAAYVVRRSANELFEQGVNAYAVENYAEAISAWEQALQVNPGDARTREYIQRAKSKMSRR